jgi:hypothetical protein
MSVSTTHDCRFYGSLLAGVVKIASRHAVALAASRASGFVKSLRLQGHASFIALATQLCMPLAVASLWLALGVGVPRTVGCRKRSLDSALRTASQRVTGRLSLVLGCTFTTSEFSIVILSDFYLVDPASSHMLVSKIKPCMSQYLL